MPDGTTTPPRDGSQFRHRKRGTTYTFVGIASVQAAREIKEGHCLAVYRGTDGRLWVRPPGEFFDGRFERLPTAPADEGGTDV
ncbi:hypothetical protein [Roseomonas elaeocarpi]|uniref:DUF1653 domain-containing protein n=1 Tax=Roseomonas elaeocarpi TaxID=907779 RepID=A0ABV6JQF3_9PROT